MNKPTPRIGLNSKAPYCNDEGLFTQTPHLAAALYDSTYADGSHKGAGILILKARGGKLSATLKIDGTGMMLRLDGCGLFDLVEALDALLSLQEVPWEVDPRADEYEASKKKKKGS